MCLAEKGWLQGWTAKLLLARWESWYSRTCLKPNGPAIWGGCVTRRSIRARSRYPAPARPEICHAAPRASIVSSGGARRVCRAPTKRSEDGGALFASHGTNYNEHYACRGTSLIETGRLSPCRIFVRSTRAVSRYNLSRSQKTVTVQDLYCVQVRESGFKMLNEFLWPADSYDDKRSKRKEKFGPILNIHFLLGWRALT